MMFLHLDTLPVNQLENIVIDIARRIDSCNNHLRIMKDIGHGGYKLDVGFYERQAGYRQTKEKHLADMREVKAEIENRLNKAA